MKQKILRHPNVMSEAERLALPDPCRPIDVPVVPAGIAIDTLLYPDMPDKQAKRYKKPTQKFDARHQADTEPTLSSYPTDDFAQFIQTQQHQSHHQPCQFRLPLALIPKLVKDSGQALIETVMTNHPQFSLFTSSHDAATLAALPSQTLSQLEMRLYLMGHMYQLMLSVFLLCQCKTRKTLNHQLTLQDLTEAINAYIEAHRLEVGFVTHDPELTVEVAQVQCALLALGWPISQQPNLAERVTIISAKNPLTGC